MMMIRSMMADMRRVRMGLLATGLVLGGCSKDTGSGKQSPKAEPQAVPVKPASLALVDISTSFEDLRTEFNAKKSEARFLTLLSPTCGACISGAEAVQQSVLADTRTAALRSWIVWIPMMDSDEVEAAQRTATRIFPGVARQFWDGERKLGFEISKTLGVPDQPAWDIYLFYPPGVEWTEAVMPLPEKVLVQAGGVVVGAMGTLPPSADQSKLLPELAGKAEVVGAQKDIVALLSQVAVPFAEAHARR